MIKVVTIYLRSFDFSRKHFCKVKIQVILKLIQNLPFTCRDT